MAQVLVPLKDLVQAKTRLAGLLRPSERRALAQAMVEDVLSVVCAHPDVTRVTLVSDDPCASMLAERYGAQYWSERALGCVGLNAVIRCAVDRLAVDETQPILVLHGDLPLLSAGDITAVLHEQEALGGLVIGCDNAQTGTNLLAFAADNIPEFHFGTDSCAAHLAWAQATATGASIIQRPGIAADVDEPQDLRMITAAAHRHIHGKTFALLRDTALGRRVAMALATVTDENRTAGESAVDKSVGRGIQR